MGEIWKAMLIALHFFVDKQSENAANDSVAKFAQNAMRQLRQIGAVAAAIAFDKVVQNLLKATSQAEETAFVFENIYGDLSDSQAKWAEEFADTYNRSATKVKETLAQIQHEMIGFTKAGTDEEKKNVAEMSKTIEQAALNLGAFYGLDSKTAINTLLSATQGSDAAMQTFNVGQGTTLTRNRQEAMRELLSEGALSAYSARSYENLTPYEKSLVNLRTVLNANKQATDALAKSQGNYATMQENLQESLAELKETLGKFFLPTAKKIVDFLTIIVRYLNDVLGAVKKVTDFLGVTELAVNMLAGGLAVLVGMRVVGWARGVITALRGIATAATGAGAGVGALGTAAIPLAVTLALLVAVYAVVSDINKFLKGESSKTGTFLEHLGLDAEKWKPVLEGLRNVIIAVTMALLAMRVAAIVTGTAIMATPVGWIIAAIALLIGVLVVVIKYWDNIRAKLKQWTDWLHEKISKAPILAAMLSAIFTGPIGPIIILIRHFDEIKKKVVDFFKTVKETLTEFENSIPVWLRAIIAFIINPAAGITFLIKHIQELRDTAEEFYNWLLGVFGKIPDWAQMLMGPIGGLTLLVEHFDEVKTAAQTAWEWVQKFYNFVRHPFGGGEGDGGGQGGGRGVNVSDALRLFNLGAIADVLQYARSGNVSGSTLAMASGTYNSSNRNVTQNITFNQEFKGSESMDQKIARSAEESYESAFDKFTSAIAKLLT